MIESLMDALLDTGRLIPVLLVVYLVVALLEYRYGDGMGSFLTRAGIFGPVAGAVLGCIPQCGFSIIAAALYVKRLISAGTLLAVFLSTSDEALPMLLSLPGQAETVGTLILVKVAIAVTAGVVVDLVLVSRRTASEEAQAAVTASPKGRCHSGCCSHGVEGRRSRLAELVVHPLRHTARIAVFLFVLTFLLNVMIAFVGEARFGGLFLTGTVFQPLVTALIGFIPNCFASVFLADLFASGTITFGALVSGLCAGAGLGILVLIRENRDRGNTFLIFGILLLVSYVAGLLIHLFAA